MEGTQNLSNSMPPWGNWGLEKWFLFYGHASESKEELAAESSCPVCASLCFFHHRCEILVEILLRILLDVMCTHFKRWNANLLIYSENYCVKETKIVISSVEKYA